ncbi:hypothetical protein EDB84DRAFT_1529171, partial [Lactarius hengduanensis]
VRGSKSRQMYLLFLPPSNLPQVLVCLFSSFLSLVSSHSIDFRRQLTSQRLSLRSSGTTHDSTWLSSYASILCRASKWSALPASSTYATSPG